MLYRNHQKCYIEKHKCYIEISKIFVCDTKMLYRKIGFFYITFIFLYNIRFFYTTFLIFAHKNQKLYRKIECYIEISK